MATRYLSIGCLLLAVLIGCREDLNDFQQVHLQVPRGYLSTLQIEIGDRVLSFGPFVGYYFKPAQAGDFECLYFMCFNERSFYTRDLPANTPLFEGQARLRRLPRASGDLPVGDMRIIPVFFSDAPQAWLESRPSPRGEYLHFHSAHDARGAVYYGYWLRHVAKERFTYDMGGRVSTDSPLFHRVSPGLDKRFARIIEFDHGPASRSVASSDPGLDLAK
jgi:hypothetical protein